MATGSSSLAALNRAVWSRRSEYTTAKSIRIKIGTWNVAAIQGTEKDVAGWFVGGKGVSQALSALDLSDESVNMKQVRQPVESIEDQESRRTPTRSTLPLNDPGVIPGNDEIDLYVLGLQEIVDVSSPTEALRPYHDKSPSERWKSAVLSALPRGYSLVAEQQLVGMYLIIYASSDVASNISNVSCKYVGTGLMGYMGNKGAVSIRFILGDAAKLVFINSHMAAGALPQSLERRNWDAEQIASRIRFAPIDHGHGVLDEIGDGIGDEDFAFWFGDLNYRLADLPGNDIRRLLMVHTERQYSLDCAKHEKAAGDDCDLDSATTDGESSTGKMAVDTETDLHPDQDPASLETTIASLLPHDELGDQIRQRKAFHQGWQEGKIRFMPTYKYDVGSVGSFDTSEKRRAPSWCDRILFRSRKHYLASLQNQRIALSERDTKRRATTDQTAQAVRPSSFEYDPDEDGCTPEGEGAELGNKARNDSIASKNEESESQEDEIQLEYYTSHQRVLSSDHKPLDAVFRLMYTAVDPDRKTLIYQDVAREFDRTENESRPSLSVAVDTSEAESSSETIDFGDVTFNERVFKTLTIANTGQVNASFGFVMLDHDHRERLWLGIECSHPCSKANEIPGVDDIYLIAPGDAWSVTIAFEVRDARVAQMIEPDLGDILILRILNGKDHFLTLRARWLKTTLGLSIDQLIRLPEGGVRSEHKDDEIKCSAPRELFRLTEALENSLERCVAEWGMKGTQDAPIDLYNSSWPFGERPSLDALQNTKTLMNDAQACLDTGKRLDVAKLVAVQKTELFAWVLVRFLDSLQDGVVSPTIWAHLRTELIEYEKVKKPSVEDVNNLRTKVYEILSASTAHNVSFQLLVDMLRRMAGELAGLGSSAAISNTEEQSKRRESVKGQYITFFENVIFRPRAGEDGNTGKESIRNTSRRTLIIRLLMNDYR